ncbi:DUF6255 family natural product biosynthesis protein [Streptomyces sp. ISL-11]|uniref:DUF6255 family natural product biosynthesis protein n=1 Tax=Streptomyces sp. ISL-11 TaxID=2819174 RepID=UPI0035B18AD7
MKGSDCHHQRGWTHALGGASRCDECGVRRFTEYGAVRPPGLPQAMTPRPRDRRAADRAAALNVVAARVRGASGGRSRGRRSQVIASVVTPVAPVNPVPRHCSAPG